jgi:hypothetical protein
VIRLRDAITDFGQFVILLASLVILLISFALAVLMVGTSGGWSGHALAYRLIWLSLASVATAFAAKAIGSLLKREPSSAFRAFTVAGLGFGALMLLVYTLAEADAQ